MADRHHTRPASKRMSLVLALLASLPIGTAAWAEFAGPQKLVVVRVYFNDYPAASRYTQAEVQSFCDDGLDGLWQDISYGGISIDATVTDLLQLPGVRADYVTDHGDGDLSEGQQFSDVVDDSLEAAQTAGVDLTDAKAFLVLMAETDPAQFHRGQGTGYCNLPVGPKGTDAVIGCAIFSENPSASDTEVWGRWAHEIGHAFKAPHPSNYNSRFELMDALYPGQSGMFLKYEEGKPFLDWMPDDQIVVFTPDGGHGTAYVAAEEIPPADVEALPPPLVDKAQAVKVELTPDLYYLVSVRKRLNGDEIVPIPDEGVLIERVVVGGDPDFNDCPDDADPCPRWVNIQGVGGDRDVLWKTGTYVNEADDVTIQVAVVAESGGSVYQISVFFGETADKPDVTINPWLTPPEAQYDTTDLWIDSSCNGYGTYQHGTVTPAGDATPVGSGNGDNPCANDDNRIYARVRNIGGASATNVVVRFDVTDPLGLGINGANGFIEIGSVDRTVFPGLAEIDPGESVDVYLPWRPLVAPEDLDSGAFDFHSCIRLRIDPVADETNIANQDGYAEQENIAQFYASPSAGGEAAEAAGAGSPIDQIVHLRNDSAASQKWFNLFWESDLPPEWTLSVNDGVTAVRLEPDEVRDIPVRIVPGGPRVVGQRFRVKVGADSLRFLVNDQDPADQHPVYLPLSGVTFEVRVADPADLEVSARSEPAGVKVTGRLTPVRDHSAPILLRLLDGRNKRLARQVVRADTLGNFVAVLPRLSSARSVEAIFVGGEYQQGASKRISLPLKWTCCGTAPDALIQ